MNGNKQYHEGQPNEEHSQPKVPDANSQRTPGQVKKNPNPRANENVQDQESAPRPADDQTTGVGSEITDGEDG